MTEPSTSHKPGVSNTRKNSHANLRFYTENVVFMTLTGYFTVDKILQVLKLLANIDRDVIYIMPLLMNKLIFILLNILFIYAFATRTKPKVMASGLLEIVLPVISGFFLVFYNLDFVSGGVAQPFRPYFAYFVWGGLALMIAGGAIGSYSISHLRRSFAVFIDVRDIVQSGPYNYIRHPIYTASILGILGVAAWNFNTPFLLLAAIHIGTLVWRAFLEERKLNAHDASYHEYMMRTGRFLPRFSTTSTGR